MYVSLVTHCRVIFMLIPSAIAIYKPPDVRPILQAYQGKDIPIEYAKKEAEARERHVAEWKSKSKGLSSGGFTMSTLFGMSTEVRVSTPAFTLVLIVSNYFSLPTHPSRPRTLSKSAPKHSDSTRQTRPTSLLTKPTLTRRWRRSDKRWLRKCLGRCLASSITWPARSHRMKGRPTRPLRAAGRGRGR